MKARKSPVVKIISIWMSSVQKCNIFRFFMKNTIEQTLRNITYYYRWYFKYNTIEKQSQFPAQLTQPNKPRKLTHINHKHVHPGICKVPNLCPREYTRAVYRSAARQEDDGPPNRGEPKWKNNRRDSKVMPRRISSHLLIYCTCGCTWIMAKLNPSDKSYVHPLNAEGICLFLTSWRCVFRGLPYV